METLYESLFKRYLDALISTQLKGFGKELDGGFLCKCCKNIHGRSVDAIYAFGIAYKRYGDKKYLDALISLYDYTDNVLCTDGALYNDVQTEWRFTTTFYEIALIELLNSCESILPSDLVKKMNERVAFHAKWLYEMIHETSRTNINYCATNALALLLAGNRLHNEDYLARAKRLAYYSIQNLTENGLFYGECQPHNKQSKKGCYGIDFGYNLEETLPSLAKYAYIAKDEQVYQAMLKAGLGHLPFILPDGALDNSYGCRNYKWTYYGSRTSDGMIPLCFILAKDDKRFLEAAYRNLEVIDQCSPDGFLYGGPHYKIHKEQPCLHHTFEHINVLAWALEEFGEEYLQKPGLKLPSEENFEIYYPEMNAYRFSNDNYLVDISGYDFRMTYGGQISGGTISMLFDKKNNAPMIAGSVGHYVLTEPTNMQTPLDRDTHRVLAPRITHTIGDTVYSTTFFTDSSFRYEDGILKVNSALMDRDENRLNNENYEFSYQISEEGIKVKIVGENAFEYVLPLINGTVSLINGSIKKEENIFFLTPGFIAKEYTFLSSDNQVEFILKSK